MSLKNKDFDFPDLLSSSQQKSRRQRPPPAAKPNLLYEEQPPLTTFEEVMTALKITGIELPNPTDDQSSLAMQVAESLAQMPSISPVEIWRRQAQTQNELQEMNTEIKTLSEKAEAIELQLQEVQTQLALLHQKRDEKAEQTDKKPLHLVLRDLGEGVLYKAPEAIIKTAFMSLPPRVQQILSKVPKLIPQEKSPSFQPRPHMSQAVPDAILPAKQNSTQYSQAQKLAFGCFAFIQNSPSTESLAVLSFNDEIMEAIQKLQDEHDIAQGIVIQTCMSDNITSVPSLALKDAKNVRHAQEAPGIVPIIVVYHEDNETNVLKLITTKFSNGIWESDDEKEILKRLVSIRRNPF
jgi:hypothetical protein